MFGDCHMHMILDGVYYRDAIDHHKSPVNVLERLGYAFSAGDMLTLVINDRGQVIWDWGWEIVDDVLNIYIEDSGINMGTNMGFIYSDEKDETLQSVDGTKIYLRANETN